MFWQPGYPKTAFEKDWSDYNPASIDLRFACPLQIKFTFEQYLKHILNYEPWEYENLDQLYAEYSTIQQL
tara:strand:- start:81 stop:290 length:210 start_codon:yes stop_codon:yes gene_type:complete